jgi:arylsulfatase A
MNSSLKNRRDFLRSLTVVGLAASAAPLLSSSQRKDKRPNIVLIMADDMGYECLGCYGSTSYSTPNLDKIAAMGIRFDHCYSTPLCTPSRVQIMTGKYNGRNYKSFGYLDPKETTFGHIMQKAGYSTMIAGKWQLNGISTLVRLPDWENNKRPLEAGFDECSLWQVTKKKNVAERFWDPLVEENGEILHEELKGKYGPDHFTNYICDFMERKKEGPFLVYYPMVLVHDPFISTPDSKYPNVRGQKAFADMVAYADKMVGKIFNILKELNLLENTIVIFTGDNGTNRKLKSYIGDKVINGGKGTTPDAGTHVPLVAYWKGHTPKGAVSKDLIDFTDVLPTLAEAAETSVPEKIGVEGLSFFPTLEGKEGKKREWQYCHYTPKWGAFPESRYARNQRFKLYHDGRFYDIPADVLEQHEIDMKNGEIELKAATRKKMQKILNSMPKL